MPVDLILLLLALLGHGAIWVAAGNRIHATAMPRRARENLSAICAVFFAGLPAAAAAWCVLGRQDPLAGLTWSAVPLPVLAYLTVCWIAAAGVIRRWIRFGPLRRRPDVLRGETCEQVDLGPPEGPPEDHAHHGMTRLPGNEILRPMLVRRTVEIPRLAEALDGLSIVHLSDFHFSGRIGKGYFRQVVAQTNRLQPDLVAITGDLVDRPELIGWIGDTLGRLRARWGVYYILGNHDRRVESDRLRRALDDCGLVGLGGRSVQIEIHGQPVVLAGNELPWFALAAELADCPTDAQRRPLRVVLAHSPDQLAWARARDVDLLLAGHTHGGQICLPGIGPLLSPCREGVKYAAGLFHAPPTILQVTRGISALTPARFFCPPEMVQLTLRHGATCVGDASS